MIELFLRLWETQTGVMIVWSLTCFLLGNVFCATCYWYRIRLVMKVATHKVEELAEEFKDQTPNRRSTDTNPRS